MGGAMGKHGGSAMVKVRSGYQGRIHSFKNLLLIVAHELGHAFGLDHDFRDRDNVMSYGRPHRISACAAASLSVHPYFNDDIPLEEESLPTFEVISSDRYPSGATGLSARIKVSDAEGVHQVLLQDAVRVHGSILTCQVLSGEKDAVVEFEYDFLEIPGWGREGLLQRVVHQFYVDVTDIHGNDESGYLRYVEVSKHQVAVLEGHGAWVGSVAFSPDGTTLASGSSDGTAKLWDVASQEEIATLYPHGYQVSSVDFSPDGTILAGTAGSDIMLWDVASGEVIATISGDHYGLRSVVFSPDGTTLAAARRGTIVLWDVASREAIATLEGHSDVVRSVAFSPDGTTLAAGSTDGKIVMWDMSPYFAPVYRSADLDGDSEVGFSDFVKFTAKFGTSRGQAGYDARCDLDWDGTIGFADFLIFANAFGKAAAT